MAIPPIVRVQRKRTKGWRMPPNTLYVGRPTRWGNDLTADLVGTVERAIEMWRLATLRALDEAPFDEVQRWWWPLRNVDAVACWCPLDKPCHADALIAIMSGTDPDMTHREKLRLLRAWVTVPAQAA